MSWDAIIIGGGHNGLVCAAYLAKAGKKVLVLERRGVLGGAAVTEEFHPGFRNSVASYTVSLLQPKVIEDLQLHAHGLRIVTRPANNFLPLPDDRYLLSAPGRTQAEVAGFSARDAQRLPAYEARLEIFADVLRAWALRAPPDIGVAGGWRGLPALWQMGKLGRELAALDAPLRQELLDLFTLSAAEYLDRWFESEPIKALFGFDGIVGNYASPYTPGSAYVLLHHVFGQCNGVKGAWGHAMGGMGAISQAIASAAREAGAELRVDAGVRRVLTEQGRAVGVELANGETLRARGGRQRQSEAAVRTAAGAGAGTGCHTRTHDELALRFRHLPDECGAVAVAGVPRPARSGRSPQCRHHHGTQPGLHGSRLAGCAPRRLVARTDRGNADTQYAGRFTGTARAACGQPVLPARGAGTS